MSAEYKIIEQNKTTQAGGLRLARHRQSLRRALRQASISVFLMSALWLVGNTAAQSLQADNRFTNPVICADVPDPDVIRVGSDFYMISTTMHLMPGAPIMKSKDLVNWEIISYVFDEIKDSPFYDLEGGNVYGRL
jgi:arabinoxylan arabinofuranohydrolase